MKSNNKRHSSKLNIILVIMALLALIVTAITVSYSWIESANSLNINSNGGVSGNGLSVDAPNPGIANIDVDKTGEVDLAQYIDNAGSLFLAPAKLDGTTLKIKRASGNYEAATKNDIGNNYIEFDVPFTVPARYKFSFTDSSNITVGGNAANPVRTSLQINGGTQYVFDSSLNKVGTSDKSAFSVRAGQHTLKVRIWLDASTTENATAADNIKGKTVDISLMLVPEIDASLRKVTISESAHADVTATYNNGTTDVTLNEGDSATLEPGTELTVTVKTADGIVKGSDSALNGYMFKNISTDVAGSSTVLTGTVGSTNTSTHIATTTYTYTVPDDGNTADIFINTNTDRETFYIIGPGITENNNWNSPQKKTLDNYDPVNNCVYGVFTANGTGGTTNGIFKIAEKGDSSKYRDDPLYCVSLNSPTVIKGGNITQAKLDDQTSPNTCFTYTTSSSGEKMLVIYYLDDNEVEIASGSTYVAQYTATAKVSTTNSNGTATVTYGDTTASTVSVPRRAADKNVTFKATPSDSDYKFVGWSTTDDGTSYVSTNAEYTTAITGDLTLYANFKRVYTLTVTPADMITADGVTFDIDQSTTKGTASIVEGTDVNLTASSPNSSNTYKVVWLDNAKIVHTETIGAGQSKTTSSYTISNMSAAHDIIVQYIQLYTLTVQKTGDGASDSNATVSAVVKDAENNTYELSNGVAYVPANTTVTVTANVAAGGYPYRVSSDGVKGSLNGKQDLIPTSTDNASFEFNSETINANTTIRIDFTRLYKLTYSLVDSVSGATIAAQATESGSTSKAITSPAYMPENTVVEFTVTPSGDDYIHAYSLNGGTTYTIGTLPSQTVTADTDIKVKVVNSRNVTINVPDPTVATLTATYTFPGVTGSETLTIDATAGPQSFKLPQGATITVTANILDSKDKFTDFTVTGSTEVTQNADNKSVAVVVQGENITITPNIAIMAVAECAQEILNGTNVSFYAGNKWGNTTTYYYSSSDTTKKSINTSSVTNSINYGAVTGTDLKGVLSGAYSLTNSTTWEGVTMSSPAEGGYFYYLNSDSLGTGNRIDKIAATTATTTLSASEVELNATGVTVTTDGFTGTTTAVGTQFYVQHFIKKSTDSQYTFLATSPKITATTDEFVTDISDYAKSAGTYEIKTVLTDGKVYYVVDTDTITVVEKFNVTVESTSNANLVVKNGSTTLDTINAGASAQTFRVVKGDSITVTATPTDNTGVYDFQWTSTGKTISKETYKATSAYTETINNDTTIGVTVDNHCYKLTYSGVTATPASDSYVSAGTNVTLTFKDTTNHNKVVWSVNGTEVKTTNVVEKGSEDTYTVKMDADKTVSVSKTTLYKLTYSLKSGSVTGSSVSAKVGTTELSADTDYYYPKDTVVSLTATKPDTDNYYLVTWYDSPGGAAGGESPGGINKDKTETKDYTISSSDIAITVSITKIQTYAVKINKPTNASLVATYEIDAHTGTFENINTSGATVNLPEGATVKVTATALTGYQFDSYTVKTGTTTETKTDSELTVTVGTQPVEITVNTSAAAARTIYFKNTKGWTTIKAYAWDEGGSSKNADWPGVEMTQVSGNIYSVTISDPDIDYIIFNNGSDGNDNQTANYAIPTNGDDLFTITGGGGSSKLTGEWSKYSGITEYTVTVASVDNAEVKVTYGSTTITEGNSASVPENTEITVTVNLNDGYELKNLSINGTIVSPTVSGNTATYTCNVEADTSIAVEVTEKGTIIYLKNSANWEQPRAHIWISSSSNAYKTWNSSDENMTYDTTLGMWYYKLPSTVSNYSSYDRVCFHVNGSSVSSDLVLYNGYVYDNTGLFTWKPKDSSVSDTKVITLTISGNVASADTSGKPMYYLTSKTGNSYYTASSKTYSSTNTYTFTVPNGCTSFTIERKDPNNLTGTAWNTWTKTVSGTSDQTITISTW